MSYDRAYKQTNKDYYFIYIYRYLPWENTLDKPKVEHYQGRKGEDP